MRSIDINADVGEGGKDEALLPFVSSASIACGGHAGDAETMRRVLRMAIAGGVQVGAHPGYADREGFGRRPMRLTEAGLRELLINQIETLDQIAQSEGTSIVHVKPHGALYNQAEDDDDLATGIVAALRAFHRPLRLLARAGSAMVRAAKAAACPFLRDAFADPRYRPNASLTRPPQRGALITKG